MDRYGVRWQVVPEVLVTMYRSRDRARARRVLEALQAMVKVDIAALKKAWRGEGHAPGIREESRRRLPLSFRRAAMGRPP